MVTPRWGWVQIVILLLLQPLDHPAGANPLASHGRPAGGGRPRHHATTSTRMSRGATNAILAVSKEELAQSTPTLAQDLKAREGVTPAVWHANSRGVVPAFRFTSRPGGVVECLLRGDKSASRAFVLPVVTGAATGEFTAKLPPPSLMDPGSYAVRCVRLYGESVGNLSYDADGHWRDCTTHRHNQPKFDGTILEPASGAPSLLCRGFTARLLDLSADAGLASLLASVKRGACPGVIAEAAQGHGAWDRSEVLTSGPPAVVRVEAAHSRAGGVATSAGLAGLSLPRCAAQDAPGRWLPRADAVPLVTNGRNIPLARAKVWVPYGCRPTYWDIAALRRVAAADAAAAAGASEARARAYIQGEPPV